MIIQSSAEAANQRVLGLFGSARKGGNSDILLEEFLRGCEDAGAEVERIHLNKLQVSGCLACGGCEKDGHCVVKDDMSQVYDSLERCNLVVIAAPIYFYSVPAQAKAVIDRSQALWSRKYILKKSGPEGGAPKKGFFIAVGATRGKKIFEGVCLTVKYFFDAIDVPYTGELLYRGVDAKGDIRKHPEALQECYDAGTRFVSA